MFRKACLIVNPHAGKDYAGRLADKIEARLAELGMSLVTRHTRGPGDATQLAADAVEDGCDGLIIAGGDGTLFEVLNGCLRGAGPTPGLAMIPLGTGNDFAKMLGLPLDWADACDRLYLGTRQRVDIGQCNDIFFANGIGIGLDAQVADEANRVKWLRGESVYMKALLKTVLFKFRTPMVTIEHDRGRLEQEITLIAAANGACYGGAFHIAPGALIDDGRLDLVVADRFSRRQVLKLVPKVLDAAHLDLDGVRHTLTRRVTVSSESPLMVHGDGEILYRNARRLEIGILPEAVEFIC